MRSALGLKLVRGGLAHLPGKMDFRGVYSGAAPSVPAASARVAAEDRTTL